MQQVRNEKYFKPVITDGLNFFNSKLLKINYLKNFDRVYLSEINICYFLGHI
jgi:hypothetical protein